MESRDISRQLYSCTVCEENVLESDLKQLGISAEQAHGKKRLKGVVVDAKVVALLKYCKTPSDSHDVLKAVGGIPTRVIFNRDTQNAMRYFVKLVRACIANKKNGGHGETSDIRSENYIFRGGYLYIRLLGMTKYGATKGQCERAKVLQ